MNNYTKFLDDICRRHGRHNVFSDFLVLVVCSLSLQKREDEYMKVAKKYTPEDMKDFSNAFAELVHEMNNHGEGLLDCLGGYFEENCATSKLGQFFTPISVSDLMAQLSKPVPFTTVCDPCCGSGRSFLSAAKITRFLHFYGADISLDCVNMTLINMTLNGLTGRVDWMNSLSLECWRSFEVDIHHEHKIPYIKEVPTYAQENDFSNAIEQTKQLVIDFTEVPKETSILKPKFKRFSKTAENPTTPQKWHKSLANHLKISDLRVVCTTFFKGAKKVAKKRLINVSASLLVSHFLSFPYLLCTHIFV